MSGYPYRDNPEEFIQYVIFDHFKTYLMYRMGIPTNSCYIDEWLVHEAWRLAGRNDGYAHGYYE